MKIQDLDRIILDEIRAIIGREFKCPTVEIDVSIPPENVDAELAVACFPAAKQARCSPGKIASTVAARFGQPEWLDNVKAAGPYLNFRLKPDALFRMVIDQSLSERKRFGHTPDRESRTVLVEYSSPNTNKPLHLGHIRNNVLGMAIINLLTARGHRVIPATILNDRGIHICKAMVGYRRFGNGRTPDSEGLKGDHFVGRFYVAFEREIQAHPELMDEARDMLRDWESGDPEVRNLWSRMNGWVAGGFDRTYRRMGSRFELVQYESETYSLGRKVVEQGLADGVLQRRDDGSVRIDLSDFGLDEKIMLRADGTSVYITQDLGVAVERFQKFNPDRVIYIVGSEQIYHFRVLFEVLKRLGYGWADRCRHLSYGMVYLPEGKMKSREGKVVDADQLMDRMRDMALEVMQSSAIEIEGADRLETAEAIGLGAIKYFILKVNPMKDIHFDPRASLAFEGATGAYLQYTYARIQSMLRKAGCRPEPGENVGGLESPEEIALARSLLWYPNTLRDSAEELNPSKTAGYLFEMARNFNTFYHKHRVLDAACPTLRTARLALSAAAANGLESGMSILGIQPLHRM
ncbi:arginine--tRNA ligase [bacterium]|nr:arginine--tRNA ligase [candidate division CSSED10-310 bacterium]